MVAYDDDGMWWLVTFKSEMNESNKYTSCKWTIRQNQF
jgi:hypothetical protein